VLRVVPAEGQADVRSVLRLVPEEAFGMRVVAAPGRPEEPSELVEGSGADLVLIDRYLCDPHTADLVPRLRARCPAGRALSARPARRRCAGEGGGPRLRRRGRPAGPAGGGPADSDDQISGGTR
jgi:hypothetical protein